MAPSKWGGGGGGWCGGREAYARLCMMCLDFRIPQIPDLPPGSEVELSICASE
jgi:hypothetical protein